MFTAFDTIHLHGLLLNAHILVNNADAAQLGHRHGHVTFCYRVHRAADDRQTQADIAGNIRTDVNIVRDHFAISGFQKDVIKRQSAIGDAIVHVGGSVESGR